MYSVVAMQAIGHVTPKKAKPNYNASLSSPKSETSPSLKKRFEQADVEARAQRKTPELPQLASLKMCILEGDSNDVTAEGIRKDTYVLTPTEKPGPHCHGIRNDSIPSKLSKSPSLSRMRVRTLEQRQSSIKKDLASIERMKRNTDSMLEDHVIANKLKRRLGSRREQINKLTVANTVLSDFIMKSITEGSLDAVAAAQATNESLNSAADLACQACLEGYFENIEEVHYH